MYPPQARLTILEFLLRKQLLGLSGSEFFSAELSLLELPLVDGMVFPCFAFVNILTPLK